MKKIVFFNFLKTGLKMTLLLAISCFGPGTGSTNVAHAQAPASTDACGQLLVEAEARFLATLPADGSIPVSPETKAAAQEYIRVSKVCYDAIEAQTSAGTLQEEIPTFIDDGGVLLGNESAGEYVLTGSKWGVSTPGTSGGTVTYSFMGNGISFSAENHGTSVAVSSLPGFQACFVTEIQNAFAAWQAVSNIQFVQVADNGVAFNGSGAVGDIRIGAHMFDGPSGTLAHAYFPPPNGVSAAGDLHFDSAENWKCNTSGIDIGIVALHEIGHSLGLNHENTGTTAVMDPTYNPGLTGLQADDINGAASIYGPAALSAPPVNDNFADAATKTVGSIPYSDTLDTTGATIEANDPTVNIACDGLLLERGDASVWYKYTPGSSRSVSIDTTGSNYDTYIAVWTGNAITSLTLVGCDDDTDAGLQSQFTLDAIGGTTYYIEVAEYAGSQSNPNHNTIDPGGNLEFHVGLVIPSSWAGGVVVQSDRNVVAVGRPHVAEQVMTYDGFPSGSLTAYVPMLFNGSFGGTYNSAFYVQNVTVSNSANITIKFYDSNGSLNCTLNDSIAPLASKGYWVPSSGCVPGLPGGWVGGVVITSDRNIVAVGRPHIGTQVTSYNGFASGSLSMSVPMLFKNAFKSGTITYDAALYVQNVNASNTANITIKYYDSNGNLNCTKTDTVAPLASKGYWVPSETCLPDPWVGGAVITSDQNVVAVGRPHIGTEVTSYNGFAAGSLSSYLPMLFNGSFGGTYNAAFYIQNVNTSNTASITIKYYNSNGTLNCTVNDTISPLASKGYWVPSATCAPALPAGWVGSVVVTSNQNIVAVGRPHIGSEVASYDGFAAGNLNSYVPMLFKNAFGAYNSAFYLQNVDPSNTANVTLKFYDVNGNLVCTRNDTVGPLSSLGFWLPDVSCTS